MILGIIRSIKKDDLARFGELPRWLDVMLSTLNEFIEKVGRAVQGNLTLKDNMFTTRINQEFVHGVEKEFSPAAGTVRVEGIIVVDSGGEAVENWKFDRKQSGKIGITIEFKAGGTTAATCTIYVLRG